MSEQLITLLYQKLKQFKDPFSGHLFDTSNNNVNIIVVQIINPGSNVIIVRFFSEPPSLSVTGIF